MMTNQEIEQLKERVKAAHENTVLQRDFFEEIYNAIEHLQSQVPKWVPVEEWEKKDHEAVLVRTSDSKQTDILQWNGFRWTDECGYGYPVTHVMALPEGPKS